MTDTLSDFMPTTVTSAPASGKLERRSRAAILTFCGPLFRHPCQSFTVQPSASSFAPATRWVLHGSNKAVDVPHSRELLLGAPAVLDAVRVKSVNSDDLPGCRDSIKPTNRAATLLPDGWICSL